MFKNNYSLVARYYPAALCSVPLFILSFYYLEPIAHDFLSFLGNLEWISGVTMSVIFVYLQSQLVRFLGKVLEDWFFKNEAHMPTTNLLLTKDKTFSDNQKERIKSQIFSDFSIVLPSKRQESTCEDDARKKIYEAVNGIRKSLRENALVFQHLTEYGFWRNLAGGSISGFVLSVVNLLVFSLTKDWLPFNLSLVMLAIYLMFIFLSKKIITWFGYQYAKILFYEYLSTSKGAL